MKEIKHRLLANTPSFWKGVRKLMIAVGTVSGALVVAPGIPAIIVTVAGYGIAIGTVGTALASLTKE